MAKELGLSVFADRRAFGWDGYLLAARLAKGRVITAANILARGIRHKLNQGGTGRWYASRTGHGLHQASAPGEPPSPDTRNLQRSVSVKDRGFKGAEVHVKAPAAATLEFGSAINNLEPRPYMRPSLSENRAKMNTVLVTAVKVELRTVWLAI